ncbi:YWTD domain-containing protein [Aspergillus sclerotioniger CBS 115572]|uniref:YWTD domain-containing protein n=1 Tax=Aspergillus sclerotioniger CBS 115572 TaxID=1450535 RepID=A0A317WDL6_9EURO|nr:YWTD domain-containing protein [Aspergillus sclerotioniger CBS 115572]PWY83821.1 YWTD domain-containing protein [Aspergillus sclerotioniger CBS 115572]
MSARSQPSRPITVLGAGILGRRIASVFLSDSHKVHLCDPSHDALSEAEAYINSSRDTFSALTSTPHPETGPLSLFTDRATALDNAWLVVEAVPEILDLKIETFEEVDRLVPDDCILATNSSSFRSGSMVSGLSDERKKRVLNVHFTMPPGTRTVELMTCGNTAEDVIHDLVGVLERCGLCPFVAREESTGLIFNRLWATVKREILCILAEGVTVPQEIDRLWKNMFDGGASSTPCRLMDRIGLDTVALIEDHYIQERNLDGRMTVDWLREEYINKGRLGCKSELGGLYPPEPEGASAQLYVLDVGLGANNELHRIPTAGRVLALSPQTGIFTTLIGGLSLPDGIDVSPSCGRIFWTSMGRERSTFDGSMQSAKLDGSDLQTILKPGTLHTPKQLIVDDVGHKLYFCDREGMGVHRCNFDGSEHQVLVQTGSVTVLSEKKDMMRWCVGVALDRVNGFVYWSQKGPSKSGTGRIFRAGIDVPDGQTARNRGDVECLLEGLPEPVDLEFDNQTRMLYWTDRGEHPTGCSLNRIDLSGQVDKAALRGRMEILARQFNEPIGLKTTTKGVYVTDLGGCVYLVAEGKKTVVAREEACLTGIAILEQNA